MVLVLWGLQSESASLFYNYLTRAVCSLSSGTVKPALGSLLGGWLDTSVWARIHYWCLQFLVICIVSSICMSIILVN